MNFNDFLYETRLWGMTKDLEDLSKEELEAEIEKYTQWIKFIAKNSTITDTGFDKERISTLRQEMDQMKRVLAKKPKD